MENFPGMEFKHLERAILDIKYDGPSFDGVMDITNLGNELLGLEYCIRKAFKEIKKSDKGFSKISEKDLNILVEPFENNCFRKKITISAIRKGVNGLTNKEIQVSSILSMLVIAAVGGMYVVVKDLSEDDIQKISMNNITPEIIDKVGDKVKLNLLSDTRFRKELVTVANSLYDKNDFSEVLVKNINGDDELIVIKEEDKNKFLKFGSIDRGLGEDLCYVKEEKLYGRINAIDVDATKRQIGFKIDGEGKEIDCYLRNGMNIYDYKDLIGEWVTIEGVSSYEGETPSKIEIDSIIKDNAPLNQAKALSFNMD